MDGTSLCREAAGIAVKRRDLEPVGTDLQRRHSAAAQEYLDRVSHAAGAMRVRAPARRSLQRGVGLLRRRKPRRLMALSDDELSEAAEKQSHSIFGRVQVEPGRNLFPLAIEQPRQYCEKPHRTGRRIRPCGAADRRAGPQHGTARRRRSSPTSPSHAISARRGPRRAPGPGALPFGPALRRHEPDLCDRYRQPLAAQRFPPRAVAARGRPAPDRLDRPAPPSCDARGPRAVVAASGKTSVSYRETPADRSG